MNEYIFYIYKGLVSSIRKVNILPLVTGWVNPEGIMLTERNQTEKDKYCMAPLTGRILQSFKKPNS